MEDGETLCSLLEAAAQEGDGGLPKELAERLNEVFERCGGEVNGEIWHELGERHTSLVTLVGSLAATMEKCDELAFMAARIYLGLLLAPNCPSYSLFSPLAFQMLFRCIRNACKSNGRSTTGENSAAGTSIAKKGKGKRARQQTSSQQNEVSPCGTGEVFASKEDVIALLALLKSTLRVISLKEHQESLKSLVEFLVELPHLASEMPGDEGSQKPRKNSKTKNSGISSQSVVGLVFGMLKDALEPSHGDPTTTAVILLKSLTGNLLLMQAGGGAQQKQQIRAASIDFVVKDMLGRNCKNITTSVVALSRYLCFKAPDKNDARTQAVDTVLLIVKALDLREQLQFGKFVSKLARGKTKFRIFAVDMALALLQALPDPLRLDRKNGESVNGKETGESNVNQSEENISSWWGFVCLETLLQRCSDKVPAVRSRALTNLAHAIDVLSGQRWNRLCLQQLLGLRSASGIPNVSVANTDHQSSPNAWDTPFQNLAAMGSDTLFTVGTEGVTPALLSPGSHRGDLGSLLRKRCLDDKAAVRKGALVLMTKSLILMGRSPDEDTLKAMGTACSDSMVSIRKAALNTLSEVVRRFARDQKVVDEWLQSALPLAIDNETSIQEDVMSLFQELVLDPVASISTLKLSDRQLKCALLESLDEPERVVSPGVIHFLKGIADGSDTASLVKRICMRLGKKKVLRPSLAMALQSIINALEDLIRKKRSVDRSLERIVQGAWFLLSEVSSFLVKAIGWDFIRHHWELLDKAQSRVPVNEEFTPVPFSSCVKGQYQESAAWAASRVHLLQTISNVAIELPADAAADLADELLKHLEDFNMHPAEVGAHVNALTVLCKRKAVFVEEGEQLVVEWVRHLLTKAEAILEAYIAIPSTKTGMDPQTPQANSRQRSTSRKRQSNRKSKKSAEVSNPLEQIVTAMFTIGAIVLICPSTKTGRIVSLLQEILSRCKTKPSSAGSSLHQGLEPAVYAQVWVSLGKMCLADDKLAKQLIPLFVQELEQSQSAAVRNNIMVILTDFCVRYTALVDGYTSKLTKSLRDPCEIVRRQTFVLLARLLQRDYVKWRGMLFHRFLVALVDDSEKICQMANFLFGSILKTKAPLLAYNSFVEAIFVLNDYQSQASGSSAALQTSEKERDLFSLKGSSQRIAAKRMHIYTALLKQMIPEHLLATSAKLCAEVIAGAVDGLIDLKIIAGQCVTEDALKILASKEMRIVGQKGGGGGENADDEDVAFAAVKGKVVTQLAKKNLVQNAIPIFIELKRLLEERSSPLLGTLLECMRVMLKDYKNEIEEMLVGDKQLQKEMMYDINKHEVSKARAKQQQQLHASAAKVGDRTEESKGIFAGNEENIPPSAFKQAANPASPLLRNNSTRVGVAAAGTSRVTWIDQTASPMIRKRSRMGMGMGMGMGIVSPNAVQRQCIVGGVGDVAAAATVASVLEEVASGKSTPLRSIALPRVHHSALKKTPLPLSSYRD